MLMYLWNFCKCALLKITALLWNSLELVHGELQHKLNNPANGEQQQQVKSKVSMANEVWTEVLGFIKREELANPISLTNRHIHQICWPRLHGNRVMAHEADDMKIVRRYKSGNAFMVSSRKEVPFAECPPPNYITQFRFIQIHYINDKVLAFINVIAPLLTKTGVHLDFLIHIETLDGQQRGLVNQLVQIFREDLIRIFTEMANIPLLPDMDNQKNQLYLLNVDADTDIPLLMNMLATPHPSGKQRVIHLFVETYELVIKMLDAIKEDFRTSIQPLPQPFYINCYCFFMPDNLDPRSEEENAQTDETLIISPVPADLELLDIYRHPKGEHEKWAEDAREREQTVENDERAITSIDLYHPDGI